MPATANGFIGRKESVGVALETTPGTFAAAQGYVPHLAVTMDPKTNTVDNNSAMGRYEQTNDSIITEQWVEGSLNGKVYGQVMGWILANMFGSVSSALHAGETIVRDHTFTILQSAAIPTMSLTRINPVETLGYSGVVLTDLEIDIKLQDWVTFTATFQGKTGSVQTATATYIANEPEFTSKDVVLKLASNLAGLAGASAVDFKSIKLKLSRKVERYTPAGAVDPSVFDIDSYDVSGTIVTRFTDTTLKALGLANTAQAMSLSITNQALTIGSTTKPALVFTMPKVRLTPPTLDNNLDQVLNQTFTVEAQFDSVAGYMIQAILTSLGTGYVHA